MAVCIGKLKKYANNRKIRFLTALNTTVSNSNEQPTCYIIAGPNGAGKTTFAMDYLPLFVGCRNFINADMIAYGISPLDSLTAQYEAGKLFLNEIHKNIQARKDFAFETTLAGLSHVNLLKTLRQNSWQIILFFLWIPNADFSRDRVRQRAQDGGHDIPEDVIYRRYPRIMHNLVHIYTPLCDKIFCYDNSSPEPIPIFSQAKSEIKINDSDIYDQITRCANEYRNIRRNDS